MIGRWGTPKVEAQAKPKGFDDFDLRLGDIMRGERATLGKSLLDVQRELKIKASYIAAIENADPSAFETQGFVAGYVRSYARYLGLDPEWAYGKFCEEGSFAVAHGMSAAASSPRAARPERRSGEATDPFANPNTPFAPRAESLFARIQPGALGSSLVLLALIGVLGYGGWSVLREVQKVQFAPVEQTPGVVSDVAALSPADPIAAATPDLEVVAAASGVPSSDALDRLYRPQALDVPVMVARDGPISTLDPNAVGTLPAMPDASPAALASAEDPAVAAAIDSATSAVQVLAADSPEVVMFAVRPSWVRVQAADGTVLFEKILDAGEKYALPRTEMPPLLRAGNAGSVYFAVNGETYGPAGKGGAVVKNVTLSPDSLVQAYALADPAKDSDLAAFVALAQATPGQ